MHIVYWLRGIPESYNSVFTVASANESANAKNIGNVDDNALVAMNYDDGCIAVNESSGVNSFSPMVLEVSGEKGSVCYTCDRVMKLSATTNGGITEVPQCPSLPHPLLQFINENILPGCGIDDALAVNHMMNEAYKDK